jgi:hypothetical protein
VALPGVGADVSVFCVSFGRARNLAFKPSRCVDKVRFVDDVIAPEDLFGFVPTDFHGRVLRDATAN